MPLRRCVILSIFAAAAMISIDRLFLLTSYYFHFHFISMPSRRDAAGASIFAAAPR